MPKNKKKQANNSRHKILKARTPGQIQYLETIDANSIIFCSGPAGTGKSVLAVYKAVEYFYTNTVQKMIFTRPAVTAEEDLGHLPGDIQEKVDPYLQPIYEALLKLIPSSILEQLIQKKAIEVVPVAFLRGRNFENAFVVMDEAQNTTRKQMLTFLTRLNRGSKMIINGDLRQSDIKVENGLENAFNCLNEVEDIGFVELHKSDIQRHKLVGEIINKYII